MTTNTAHLHDLTNFSGAEAAQDPSTILHDRTFNKGTAFTAEERANFGLRGLLPPRIETIEQQAARCMLQLSGQQSQIEQFNYLQLVKHSNETLFYYLLTHHLEQLCPLVYTPTVGQACQQFGEHFRFPEGLFLNRNDKGQVRAILDNWKRDVAIIVVTDGSRILGLGDLGAGGMGIPIGKLSLYVAAAGFHPRSTLPICLDLGTDTTLYHANNYYLGSKEKRLDDPAYYEFLEEFCMAVKDKWPKALLQFEDFSNNHCFDLLDKYRHRMRCFNDDIQGTGAVIAAGFITAVKVTGVPHSMQKIVFHGAGSAGIGVADQIVQVMIAADPTLTPDQARARFYFVDSKGLVTSTRPGQLEKHKLPYARSDMGKEIPSLIEVIREVRPTALIGLSGQGGAFNDEILTLMGKNWPKPIIFALSNPTKNAECSAEAAYRATNGHCVYASGSPFAPVEMDDGRLLYPGQGNNMYIFPGLGFGAWLCQAKEVSDEMIIAAATALADFVTPADISLGRIYPALDTIREISAVIAMKVIDVAFAQNLAQIERPKDVLAFVKEHMYNPIY